MGILYQFKPSNHSIPRVRFFGFLSFTLLPSEVSLYLKHQRMVIKEEVQSVNQPLSNKVSDVSDKAEMSECYNWNVKTIGIPKEILQDECRVAGTPDTVATLTKKGFRVLVESGAGAAANFTDDQYVRAGADIVNCATCFTCDVMLKVNPVTDDEVARFSSGQTVYSMVKNMSSEGKEMMEKVREKGVNLFGMECVPRISRAQVFDSLSSMANIAGYKAVSLAAHNFGGFLGGQMTAAGRVPPAKVLVIGGGVAGLSAIVHAKNMGAIVRCFDTRPAVREQVESLGGEFLDLPGFELKEGAGGYAAEMTKEFIDAEMKLFADQAKECDVIITTALIPGKPAPRLISKEVVATMKHGSVVVDLAAENGGNIETTRKGECYKSDNGVTHVGYTDLPSRLPTQSSRLFSNNILKLFLSMTSKEDPSVMNVDFSDVVTRGCCIALKGKMLYPPPPTQGPPPQGPKKAKAVVAVKEESPFAKTLKTSLTITMGMLALMSIQMFGSSQSLLTLVTIFVLAGAAGYQAVWGVVPALHTPLMAVTNAISGITAFGGIIMYTKSQGHMWAEIWSAVGTSASCINIFGGFLVTYRMLEMFRRPEDPNEHLYLYLIPGLFVPIIYLADEAFGINATVMTYVASSLCCIGSIAGLASQKTARIGAGLGMIGVMTGLVCTFGMVELNRKLLIHLLSMCSIGGIFGWLVGRAVQVTELPQTVAGFHSLVGLAAMVTSLAHYSRYDNIEDVTNLTACSLGNFIGGVTLTGSLVAYAKLNASFCGMKVKGTAVSLPGKNWINLISFSIVCILGWLCAVAKDVHYGMMIQYAISVTSMWMGFHLVASVGGGDMPVCITVLNHHSGWALVADGFMLNNIMMTVVGSLIGFSGGILSYIMCVAMNRSLGNVIFGGYATIAKKKGTEEVLDHKEATVDLVCDLVANSDSIIIVPGYGMAVAKAQHQVAEFAKFCNEHKKKVRFAIHPVAGRMPGQMNVLLAEAGVPYDWVEELEDINDDFSSSDMCLVVGANDITNEAAIIDPDCAIAGMPVLHVWETKNCIFMKRSMAAGYADLQNPVFFKDSTHMFLGDATKQMQKLNEAIKSYYNA